MSKNIKTIIPFIIFLIFTLLTNDLVTRVIDVEVLQNFKIAPAVYEYFQVGSYVLSLIATIILLFLSRRFTVEQIGKQLFFFAATLLGLLFFICLPCRSVHFVTESPVLHHNNIMQLYRNLDLVALFGLLTVWPSAMILFFYGYANERYTFKEAVRYYPIFGLIALMMTQFIFPFLKQYEPDYTAYSYGVSLLACAIGAIACLFWIEQIDLGKRDEKTLENYSRLGKKYIFFLGILIASSCVIIKLAQTVWNYGVVAQFPTPAEYSHYFAEFSVYSGIASIMTLSVFLFMSLCLRDRLAKAWKNIYYAIACVSLILGGAFFASVIFKVPLIEMASRSTSVIPLEALNTVGASYQILMSSIIYPVVLCLKELALIPIPHENRFTAKLSIDLIFSKGTIFLTTISLNFLFNQFGATATAFPVIAVVFFVIAIARFAFIFTTGKELIKATSNNEQLLRGYGNNVA